MTRDGQVRELAADESALAYYVMRELRADLRSVEAFVDQVNELRRTEAYRMVASSGSGAVTPSAVAGFRIGRSLAWGRYLSSTIW